MLVKSDIRAVVKRFFSPVSLVCSLNDPVAKVVAIHFATLIENSSSDL